ncbi:short-chain dehydrogenase [Pholiota conissans]|uniref:Short-chain dehydrogenase n=1 Tax=Pholiota conissans TaxID=109636 RepID=A0A9P5Z843_9AGAR|nr:short-chain dehydrogenase [Pholiota conissans]
MSSPASYRPAVSNNLSGRIAVVTGGGTGIGLMNAQGLAAAGAKVYITGRRLEVLEKVAAAWDKQIGGEIIPLQMDVTDKVSIAKAKQVIEEKEGKLHILVNNAGQVGPTSPFFNDPNAPERKDAEALGTALFNNETFEGWANLYSINAASIFFVTTAFTGLLAKGSSDIEGYWSAVVNITSISGLIKVAQDHFCYNSAKAAASHLTKMFDTEFALKGIPIRVNAIAPGVYASEMTFDHITPDLVDKIGKGVSGVPAKRAGTGQEMAGTVVYLASRAGGYTHGQEIVIDGGYVSVNPSVV